MLKKQLAVFLEIKEKIISALRYPQANPKEALLALSFLLVAALILLVVAGLIYYSVMKPPAPPKPVEVIERERKRRVRVVLLGVPIVFLAIILPLTIYTSAPSFCQTCHMMKNDYLSWKKSTHKNVNCLACHNSPGVIGFLMGKTENARMLLRFFSGSYEKPLRAEIRNESCLRCHQKVRSETLTQYGVRVSHKEIIAAGYRCTDCHNTIAHGRITTLPKYPTMDKCILCHDNRKASNKCSLCHIKDIARSPRISHRDFPQIRVRKEDCEGCHPTEKCTKCHGTYMPHTRAWRRGKHARYAFIDKRLCWRCHEDMECLKCHSTVGGHGPEWITDHSRLAGDGGPTPRSLSAGCRGCHILGARFSPNFCDQCHAS